MSTLPSELVKPLLNERDRQLVWDQLSSIVDGLNSSAEFRTAFDRRPKQFTSCNRAQIEPSSYTLALRSFPRSLGSHQDYVYQGTEALLELAVQEPTRRVQGAEAI